LGQLVILVITFALSGIVIGLSNRWLERRERSTANTQRNWAAMLSVGIAVLSLTMIWG